MSGLKIAIEECLEIRLKVYRADAKRLGIDAEGARSVAEDHLERWLFELIQNSDDAQAMSVRILFGKETIYVADDGKGLKQSSVESISAMHNSDKESSAIGRKGIGFKAVYTVSKNPQVLSRNGEGLEFNKQKAEDWMRDKELPLDKGIPYQWLPFFLSREEAEDNDDLLAGLNKFSTVVKLPFANKMELQDIPSHILLPFRSVRKLQFEGGNEKDFTIENKKSKYKGSQVILDSRISEPITWSVYRPKPQRPTNDILKTLDEKVRRRVEEDGVSFLIATPTNEDGIVRPVNEYLPIHVFYPAEEDLAPVRVLLHAEFLIKSDRTALISIESSRFNDWVADKLAIFLIDFVNDQYTKNTPAASIRLLVPLDDRETHHNTKVIWDKIVEQAKKHLCLPDVNGELALRCEDARILEVSVAVEKARAVIESTTPGSHLIHADFDGDYEAIETLKALGCRSFEDDDILKIINDSAPQKVGDYNWILACWEWVAAWLADKPWREEHEGRLELVEKLPIIPIAGRLYSRSNLRSTIITWKSKEPMGKVPNWLPIAFVDDWFRDVIMKSLEDGSNEYPLKKLGIIEPTDEIILKALEKSISNYWEKPNKSPNKFVRFLLNNDFHEQLDPPRGLQRCPILADVEGGKTNHWVESGQAYLGKEWGEKEIAKLYKKIKGVTWAQKPKSNYKKYRSILEWLGAVRYPRLVDKKEDHRDEYNRLYGLLEGDSSPLYSQPKPLVFDHLNIDTLTSKQTTSLLLILTHNWSSFYKSQYQISVKCEGPQRGKRQPQLVSALWWEQINLNFHPPLVNNNARPKGLKNCWLPDKTTKEIGEFLPIIDVEKFGEHKREVASWLSDEVKVRKRLEEVKIDEWREILSEQIPFVVREELANSDEKIRDRVKKWYEACLDSLSGNEDVNEGIFNDIPILCNKRDRWEYIKEETRWLLDDNDAAIAFKKDIWQIALPEGVHGPAKEYLGLKSLSDSIDREVKPGKSCQEDLQYKLGSSLKIILPYVFAWRCFKSKQDFDRLRNDLNNLSVRVVDSLTVMFGLNDVVIKEIELDWGVINTDFFVKGSGASVKSHTTYVAKALAQFLGIPTDAELYDNLLLRSANVVECEKKLFDNNVPQEEISRLLREYREDIIELPPTESVGEQIVSTITDPSGADEPPPHEDPSIIPPIIESPIAEKDTSTSEGQPPIQRLYLKDPENTEVEFITERPQSEGRGSGGGGDGGGNSGGTHLTQEEKWEIEKCGRACAKIEWEKMDWTVEEMPQYNPGFDLRATKDEKELRIEIKSHRWKSNIAELTSREMEEYFECRNLSDAVNWELWNVENLHVDAGAVRITRYDSIPEEALRGKLFAVDLRKCESKNFDDNSE